MKKAATRTMAHVIGKVGVLDRLNRIPGRRPWKLKTCSVMMSAPEQTTKIEAGCGHDRGDVGRRAVAGTTVAP